MALQSFNKKNMQDQIFNVQELADYLRMPLPSVYKLIRERDVANPIPGVKVGKQWRFYKSNIDMWLAGNTTVAAMTRAPRSAAPAPSSERMRSGGEPTDSDSSRKMRSGGEPTDSDSSRKMRSGGSAPQANSSIDHPAQFAGDFAEPANDPVLAQPGAITADEALRKWFTPSQINRLNQAFVYTGADLCRHAQDDNVIKNMSGALGLTTSALRVLISQIHNQ